MNAQRTALVTGAAGFVGRHVSAELDLSGYAVTALDINRDRPLIRMPHTEHRGRHLPVAIADAVDYFREARTRFDVVVHCAAVVGGRRFIEEHPAELAAYDLELDAAMWRHALATRPGRVVYLSSSARYPTYLQNAGSACQLRESDAVTAHGKPDNTYGFVKLAGEELAAAVRAAGVPVTVVRPFSGYGHDQDDTYPFPAFIRRGLNRDGAAESPRPFTIWGDGEQVRDFIHIDDVARGIVHMIRNDVDGPVNLGTGVGTSFNELAQLVAHAAGYELDHVTHDYTAPVGVRYRVANTDMMHATGFLPHVALEGAIAGALLELDPFDAPSPRPSQ